MAYPVSADFVTALSQPHTVATRVDILVDGAAVVTGLPVTDGSVTIESNKPVRRHGTLTVEGVFDELDPYGTEVAVYSGLILPNGTEELVPMGVFGVEEPEATDTGDSLTTSFEIYDRARSLQQRRLPTPYVIASGTNLAEAVQTLLLDRRLDLSFAFQSTTYTTPSVVWEEQADPWEKARDLAAAAGMELLFDPSGVCVLRAIPGDDGSIVAWSYVEGAGCQLVQAAKKRSAEGSYSHAIATGETIEGVAPVRGDAYDNDPASKTYYLGRFGDRPTWLRSPYIGSQPQADDAAAGVLNRARGLSEGLRLVAVPNPAVDADDLVLVSRGRLGVDAVYALDSVTVPLGVDGTMSAATRTRRVE